MVAGEGDDQLWRSGRGAFDNTKIGFCYLGSMLVYIFLVGRGNKQIDCKGI